MRANIAPTCSSKEMTLGCIFSKVKWYIALAVLSGRLGRCVQKSVRSCLEMTRLTFSLTTTMEEGNKECMSMYAGVHRINCMGQAQMGD